MADTPFDDDFKRGERAAKELEASMAAAEKKAANVEKAIERGDTTRRRVQQRAKLEAAEVRAGEAAISKTKKEQVAETRALAQVEKERLAVNKQIEASLASQLAATRRLRQMGPYAYGQQVAGGQAAARAMRQLPPGAGPLMYGPYGSDPQRLLGPGGAYASGPYSRLDERIGGTRTHIMDPDRALLDQLARQQRELAALQRLRQIGPYAYGQQPFSARASGAAQRQIGPYRDGPLPVVDTTARRIERGFAEDQVARTRNATAEASIARETKAKQENLRATRAAAAANSTLSKSHGDLSARANATSTAYQRFGALSTEWIGAASRGATTLGELGRQLRDTTGKFGGWLLAGSAVFVVMDAVRELGAGALDSMSGVNQLQRVVDNVDATKAQQQFRELSDEFNLPIGDVTEAAYGMGKIFHDMNDAFEATPAILYSVKVGELDVAEATRYLIAITQGFNLEAGQMGIVFDQINQAQNRFGISIGDTEAGLARASGTYRAAGGDLDSLLAILTTAQKVTGNTGQTVGTAIARAPNFMRQESNRATLASFGIDARQDIDQVIEQAFVKARSLGGERLQVLAAGIFGPQYGARVGTPLLQNEDLYRRVQQETAPGAAKGSAERELNILLGSIREQIAEIGVELQRLGSALAESGALDAFGGMLALLIKTLEISNDLLDLWNELPDPLQKGVVYLGQAVALVALLRRLNLGDSMKEGTLGRAIFRSPNQDKRYFQEGLTQNRQYLIEERERALSKARGYLADEDVLTEKRDFARRTQSAAAAAMNADPDAGMAYSHRGTDEYQQRYKALNDQQKAMVNATLAADQELLATQSKLEGVQAKRVDAELKEQTLMRRQFTVESEQLVLQNATNAQAARIIAGSATKPVPGFGRPGDVREEAVRRGFTITKDPVTGVESIRGDEGVDPEKYNASAANLTDDLDEQNRRLAGLGVTGRAMQGGLDAGGRRLDQASGYIKRNGGAFGVFRKGASKLNHSLSGLIGPLDAALIGAFLLWDAISSINDEMEEKADQFDAAMDAPTNTQAIFKNTIDKLRATARKTDDRGFWTDAALGAESVGRTIIDAFGGDNASEYLIGQSAREGLDEDEAFRQRQLRQRARNLEAQREYTQEDLAPGATGPLYGMPVVFPTDVADYMQKYTQAFLDGPSKDFAAFQAATNRLVRAFHNSENLKPREERRAIGEIRAIAVERGGAIGFDQLSAINQERLAEISGAMTTTIESGYASQREMTRFIRTDMVRAARGLASRTPEGRAHGIEAINEIVESIKTGAEARRDRILAFADSQADEDRAFAVYRRGISPAAIRRRVTGVRDELQERIRRTQALLANDQRTLASSLSQDVRQSFRSASPQSRKLMQDIEQRRKDIRGFRNWLKGLDEGQKRAVRAAMALQREADLEKLQEDIDLDSTRTDIRAARVERTDPAGAARLQFQQARRSLRRLKDFGARPKVLADAQLDLLNARFEWEDSIEEQASEMREAMAALRVARAGGDPLVEAQVAVTNARADLAAAKTGPERIQALADLITAQTALEDEIASIASARIDLKITRAEGDPVRQALLRIQQARQQFATANGARERLEALQALQEGMQELEEAHAAIAEARIDLLIAQTDNPVREANLEVRRARGQLRRADGPQERIEARTAYADAVRGRRDAIASRRMENIEFEADMDNITTQQEIAAYERILKTLTLSRDMRRDIRRKIHDLREGLNEDDGGFDLAVGDIKLPTIYDIRRAIGGAGNGRDRSMAYNDNRSTRLEFNIDGGNPQEVFSAVDNALTRHGMAARRSAGMRPG